MKGIVFTEFLEFSEQTFGAAKVDRAIVESHLPSGGSYTAVGTYDHRELIAILSHLSQETGTSVDELLRRFGQHLFGVLARSYRQLIADAVDSFSLLERIENEIHVEVRKLYPDAQLPRFTHERVGKDQMTLVYCSERALGDLAEGLLRGCFDHFGDRVRIERSDLSDGAGTTVRFLLQRD